jgi:hypothetical protein
VNAVMNLQVPYNAVNFLTENRLASQEGLCSKERVSYIICEEEQDYWH